MNIVYGGAFNPPTKAHKKIIKTLFNMFHPENVIILPVGHNYEKTGLIADEHRKNMLKLLDDRIIISMRESKNKFDGTYASLNELSKTYNDLYYVIGADNLINLDKWIKFDELILTYRFIVFGRENIDVESLIQTKYKKYENQFIYVKENIDISSTDFRLSKDKSLVDDKVYEYIINNHLYEEE